MKGFSLIEIVFVLVILGVFIVGILPFAERFRKNIRTERVNCDLAAIGKASQNYYSSIGHWPTTINDLVPDFLNLKTYENYTINDQACLLSVSLGNQQASVVRPLR